MFLLPFMKISKGLNNAANIKASICVVKWAFSMQQSPQIAAKVGISKEVDELVVFESFVEALKNDKERI